MKKVALKMQKMNAVALVNFARGVHSALTVNVAIYATPPITLVALLALIDGLDEAQQNMLTGGTAATVIRNQKRKLLEVALLELSYYVNGIAKGDEAIIHLAGMVAGARGPRRYDSLTTPYDLIAESPLVGAIKLRWKGPHNVKNYAVEHCPDPITGTQWENGTYNSGANAVLEGFDTGKKYWLRVRALGSEGIKSDWSDPICQLVS
ncbi:MAG TPA: fibronectin type III domain-containing protein [Flavipsychrobacter sp.]|nr:fibronectin type III domain-containing protein [Flavipsychrobacter sp.]